MESKKLEEYILEEHTSQIKNLRERVHEVSNILAKDQILLENLIENNKKMLIQIELLNERVHKLEQVNKDRESKLSFIKSSAKYWPLFLLILCVIDYNKIFIAIKDFLHLG